MQLLCIPNLPDLYRKKLHPLLILFTLCQYSPGLIKLYKLVAQGICQI